jgi:hypothetical protein
MIINTNHSKLQFSNFGTLHVQLEGIRAVSLAAHETSYARPQRIKSDEDRSGQ